MGAISAYKLPIEFLPKVQFPFIGVFVPYPNSHPEYIERNIAKPIEEVIAEARELAADGVRELVIVAQDTPYYGKDIYGEPRLTELLAELGLDGIDLRMVDVMPVDGRHNSKVDRVTLRGLLK